MRVNFLLALNFISFTAYEAGRGADARLNSSCGYHIPRTIGLLQDYLCTEGSESRLLLHNGYIFADL